MHIRGPCLTIFIFGGLTGGSKGPQVYKSLRHPVDQQDVIRMRINEISDEFIRMSLSFEFFGPFFFFSFFFFYMPFYIHCIRPLTGKNNSSCKLTFMESNLLLKCVINYLNFQLIFYSGLEIWN